MANRRPIEDIFAFPDDSTHFPQLTSNNQKGSVLLPCLLFLSLVGLTAMGLLKLTRSELSLSHDLDLEYQTLLGARSGAEYALLKAASDEAYTGETVHTAEMGSWEIAVAPDGSNSMMRIVTTTNTMGALHDKIEQKVYLYPRHYNYALITAGNFRVNADCKILGDVYAAGVFQGNSGALIAGDVHLYGSRTLLKNVSDEVISVDGYSIPTVQGSVLAEQPYLNPPGWTFVALGVQALSDGQVYTSDTDFKYQDYTGVIGLSNNARAEFTNVTLRGVLAGNTATNFTTIINSTGDAVSEIVVKGGCYLKIIADDTVAEDLAIIAPGYVLKVETDGYLDVQGSVYVGYIDLANDSYMTVTGTTMVHGMINSGGTFLGQSPYSLRNSDPEPIVFNEYEVLVRTHSE